MNKKKPGKRKASAFCDFCDKELGKTFTFHEFIKLAFYSGYDAGAKHKAKKMKKRVDTRLPVS